MNIDVSQVATQRKKICTDDCDVPCDQFKSGSINHSDMSIACPRGIWRNMIPWMQFAGLPVPQATSVDHEKEAALSGQVAGCCDGGNEKPGSR